MKICHQGTYYDCELTLLSNVQHPLHNNRWMTDRETLHNFSGTSTDITAERGENFIDGPPRQVLCNGVSVYVNCPNY